MRYVQRFMRAFVVEDFDKVIEGRLLLQEITGGGFGGFFFSE